MIDSYNKFDIILIIILCLLVSFIIGFSIVQLIDSKLNAVTINVPPNSLQPIYLNIDKNDKLHQILSDNLNDNTLVKDNSKEDFGNLPDYPSSHENPNIIASVISDNENIENLINEKNNELENVKDIEYNTVNEIPLLIVPDPPTPNQVENTDSPSYYNQRVKLVQNSDSPLLKLYNKNLDDIKDTISKCNKINSNIPPKINGTFDGYNAYVDLRNDSYANVTAIGKSMLTPFTSYPVPS
jgi:hypothetical protein